MAHLIKEENQFLLSICIPTFNRAIQLEITLNSITQQEIFLNSNKIEIVISDNCSKDDTSTIVKKYLLRHPGKIIYSRNDEDIVDKNFEKVLSLASGIFLKLNNDTLKHTNKSLEKMVNLIEKNKVEKPILFFSNGVLKKYKQIEGQGLPFFIDTVSYFSTWIATFGIWKDDFNSIANFNKLSHLKLVQVDILFELISKKKNIIIEDDILFDIEIVTKKGNYDIVEIFFDNYKFLLLRELEQKNINLTEYKKELKNILFDFFCNWIAITKVYPNKYTFTYINYKKKFSSNYKYTDYLFFLIKLNFLIFKFNLKKCLRLN